GTTIGSAIGPITGAGTVCAGTTLSLADTTSGGTWSSSNTSIGTINSSGLVSALEPGTTTISYIATKSGGTGTQYATVTVDGKVVASISGATDMCEGTTQTVTDATSGGTWASSNTGIATVSSGGLVTAVS